MTHHVHRKQDVNLLLLLHPSGGKVSSSDVKPIQRIYGVEVIFLLLDPSLEIRLLLRGILNVIYAVVVKNPACAKGMLDSGEVNIVLITKYHADGVIKSSFQVSAIDKNISNIMHVPLSFDLG